MASVLVTGGLGGSGRWIVGRLAALLLVPDLAWVLFATVLNYRFWALN